MTSMARVLEFSNLSRSVRINDIFYRAPPSDELRVTLLDQTEVYSEYESFTTVDEYSEYAWGSINSNSVRKYGKQWYQYFWYSL